MPSHLALLVLLACGLFSASVTTVTAAAPSAPAAANGTPTKAAVLVGGAGDMAAPPYPFFILGPSNAGAGAGAGASASAGTATATATDKDMNKDTMKRRGRPLGRYGYAHDRDHEDAPRPGSPSRSPSSSSSSSSALRSRPDRLRKRTEPAAIPGGGHILGAIIDTHRTAQLDSLLEMHRLLAQHGGLDDEATVAAALSPAVAARLRELSLQGLHAEHGVQEALREVRAALAAQGRLPHWNPPAQPPHPPQPPAQR